MLPRALLLSLVIMPMLAVVSAQERVLESDTFLYARPSRCIALRQGQICYQFTRFNWQTNKASDYCLYEKNIEVPLKCWLNVNNGQFDIDFQSDINLVYILREVRSMTNIAEIEIAVAWVYKSKNRLRTNWRLF